ncbi:hypothetical protein FHX08_003860 [Rhizobium sp. BK529]|uniref:hypothetical protein n=1 Tax=unclassified Rhizobium TaxID=2613769 RepID=UPI001051FB5D|nr:MULTISPECIES: hypothetical protein [unclassified Rhizobium]MBB3593457.1 hypothetical protein [Rhizobium sp. BK529]
MNKQNTGENLSASVTELCSRFSFREILVATIIARWRRRRVVNSVDAFPSWLRHDLALSDK